MDIEERAEKWAEHYAEEHNLSDLRQGSSLIEQALIDAYLAGSAQTQKDYAHG